MTATRLAAKLATCNIWSISLWDITAISKRAMVKVLASAYSLPVSSRGHVTTQLKKAIPLAEQKDAHFLESNTQ